MRPSHERVKAAGARDQCISGPKMQVICVAENNLRAKSLKLFCRNAFHRGARADRHERGRVNDAVRQPELSAARAAVARADAEER